MSGASPAGHPANLCPDTFRTRTLDRQSPRARCQGEVSKLLEMTTATCPRLPASCQLSEIPWGPAALAQASRSYSDDAAVASAAGFTAHVQGQGRRTGSPHTCKVRGGRRETLVLPGKSQDTWVLGPRPGAARHQCPRSPQRGHGDAFRPDWTQQVEAARHCSSIPPRRDFSSLAAGRGGSELTFRRREVTDIFLCIYRLCMFSPQRCFLINKEIT